MSRLLVVLLGTLALALLLVIGFTVKPAALKPKELKAMNAGTIALPKGLPAPVERYYRTFFGNRLPEVEAAVLYGRGKLCSPLRSTDG